MVRQIQEGKRASAEMARLVMEEGEGDDEGPAGASGGGAVSSKVGTWTLRLQTLAVVFVILFAIASVIVLLTNLMWGM